VSKQEIPVNERIEARVVRLVDEGKQYGVKPIEEARRLAEEKGLDLVLVAPNADPPVAKIMDYGKFKYQQKKRQHEQHRHHSQIKELRVRPKTEDHDLNVRIRQARHFIERGDRVQVTVMFRGREMAHLEMGKAMLEKFAVALQDIAKVERRPILEGRRMNMMLAKK